MNITSILITLLGIIVILALYVLSRVGQRNLNSNEGGKIPDILDDDGNKFTSILDDIPAKDGSITSKPVKTEKKGEKPTTNKQQIVLFISGKDEAELDGNLIKDTLINNDLLLGDKDIYHFYEDKQNLKNSLFRVANGVEPWTLTDVDLKDKTLIGISLVMLLPTSIKSQDAVALFLQKADAIAEQVNGVLKNQQQEIISPKDRKEILQS